MPIKYFYVLILLLFMICQNCKVSSSRAEKDNISVIKKTYRRENGKFWLNGDSLDFEYVGKWRKRENNYVKTPFPKIKPKVKNNIAIEFRLETVMPTYPYEKMSVYIDDKLLKDDTLPTRFAYVEYFPNWSKYFSANYQNKNRYGSGKITIALHTQQVYFDTIIPLRFNKIDIMRTGGDFEFAFSGVYE